MRRILFYSAAVAAMLLSSCTNSDYDLANIDTNVRLEVKNLTIPVNLEPIKLDKVLDIKDGDRIKNVNGEYAVVEDGTFNSDAIDIKPISIKKPSIEAIKNSLVVDSKVSVIPDMYNSKEFGEVKPYLATFGINDDTPLFQFSIEKKTANIEFNATNVDNSITGVDKIGIDAEMNVSLQFEGISKIVNTYHVTDLVIQLPKGLETTNTNYDAKTGILKYADIEAVDGKVEISLPLTAIDAKEAGASLKNQNFHFAQEVSAEGSIQLYVSDIPSNVQVKELKNFGSDGVKYECNAGFTGDIKVTTFTGDINYSVSSPIVNPVNLNNLPEVLQQSGTKIVMENPQIYLKVNNPLFNCNIKPSAELALTPSGTNTDKPFNQTINLTKADNVYCMSPKQPNAYYTGYADADYQQFSNLGKILACEEGIPAQIAINVDIKNINQHVDNFELKSYGKVSGSYTFYAPLALTSDTKISYEKEWDDWGDEDLDGLTVRSATITAEVTSTIPAEIKTETEAVLLGANGKEMKGTTSGLKATSEKQTLTISLSGNEINHITGLRLKVHAAGGDKSLNDQQEVKVENLKITLNGYYDKEL